MKNFNGDKIFCLEYDKETLKDMVLNKQEEIERLNNIINEAIDYLKSDNYWLSQVKANDDLLNILKGE